MLTGSVHFYQNTCTGLFPPYKTSLMHLVLRDIGDTHTALTIFKKKKKNYLYRILFASVSVTVFFYIKHTLDFKLATVDFDTVGKKQKR